MIFDLSVVIKAQEESDKNLIHKKLSAALRQKYSGGESAEFVFVKKSVDARHGQLKLCLRYKAYVGEKPGLAQKEFSWLKADGSKKVVIVGSGPAGLFAALKLLERGVQPVIIERGRPTSERKRDIAAISVKGIVDADSNYCFGEGGAGTFSDGKLYTRSNKRGDIGEVLQTFVHFGADPKILTDAHPHIGTNKLPQIINNMRQKILELGGEFHFESRVVDFIIDRASGPATVRGVVARAADGSQKEFLADAVILATGHSATDIYELLARANPQSLEAKTFAVGVRVEHPRELIDKIQYHGKRAEANLGAAEYRLTTQVEGRGVYSFCMCPGGFVVPSASGPQEIVVNGMSAAERNSAWSNAAIVVETRPEDVAQIMAGQKAAAGSLGLASDIGSRQELAAGTFGLASDIGSSQELAAGGPVLGLRFRSWLERLTYLNGGASLGQSAQAAPAQRMVDFLAGRSSDSLPRSSYTPGLVASRLDLWLPPFVARRLAEGFKAFDKNMKRFISPDALLIASETRTSTPVRILRDKATFECMGLARLYPCGEGSGWSGGIVSSAMDGQNAAAAILDKIL
ncbi:MAG: FAD-binding protein [Treponema sp.]|nr:FAD-binding protein [Treponema sp.]MEE3435683.1 FAD-binding protein [Treponema sp.]